MGMYTTNTNYYNKGTNITDNGYWTSTAYSSDNQYAYFVSAAGNNSLALKSEVKGIRPVIDIDKTLVTKGSYRTSISLTATDYNYKPVHHENHSGNSKSFNTMQGFTMAGDYLVFYSNESTDPGYGIIYWDKISSPNTTYQYANYYYYSGDHGNGMTYNKSTGEVVVLGDEKTIDKFVIKSIKAPGTSTETDYENGKALTKNEDISFGDYSGIAYNEFNGNYVTSNGSRVYLLNSSNSKYYSFDTTSFGINQSLEYHNGYVYRPQYHLDCPNKHQTWCLQTAYFDEIYVYNAKINQDGTPNADFGRLQKIYTVDTVGTVGEELEIEDLSFYNSKLYIGFNNHSSTTNPHKIYSVSASTVMTKLSVNSPTYELVNGKIRVLIHSSKDEIKASGWSHNGSDYTTIIKDYSPTAGKDSFSVCDYYNNCTSVTVNIDAAASELIKSVTGVTISPTSATLNVGSTKLFTATVSPSDATNKAVNWTSSNTSVATVDSNGLVTAKSAGTTTITVTTIDGGYKKTANVTVNNPTIPVTSLSIDKTSLSLIVGNTSKITATVSPSDATNKTVNWTSSNTSVATVDSNGLVTAKSAGSATITVTTIDGGYKKTANVTVSTQTPSTIKVQSVSLDRYIVTLETGSKTHLTASIYPSDATNKGVTWTSSNTNVATVDSNGNITGVSPGAASITVKTNDGGFTATANVSVSNPKPTTVSVTGVSLNSSSINTTIGQTIVLSATVAPSNATNKEVTWTSSNTNVATVDSTGKVTAKSVGNATITVTTKDGNYRASCSVRVITPTSGIHLSKNETTIYTNKEETLSYLILPEDATNKNVTWTSSDPTIATVDNNGKITAKKAGKATITATVTNTDYKDTCIVTVEDFISVKEIKLSKDKLNLYIGDEESLTYTITPNNSTNKTVHWRSDNDDVATVDSNGKIKAKVEGTANIIIETEDNKKTSTCTITVTKKIIHVEKVNISKPEKLSIKPKEKLKLSYSVEPSDATNQKVTWVSSDEDILQVTEDGEVLGISIGTATVTAIAEDGSVKAEIKLTVSKTDVKNPETGGFISIFTLLIIIILLIFIPKYIERYKNTHKIIHKI